MSPSQHQRADRLMQAMGACFSYCWNLAKPCFNSACCISLASHTSLVRNCDCVFSRFLLCRTSFYTLQFLHLYAEFYPHLCYFCLMFRTFRYFPHICIDNGGHARVQCLIGWGFLLISCFLWENGNILEHTLPEMPQFSHNFCKYGRT